MNKVNLDYTSIASVVAALDAANQRSRRHWRELEDTRARLVTALDMLQRAEANNSHMANELRHAHKEIAALEAERDTWRAAAER